LNAGTLVQQCPVQAQLLHRLDELFELHRLALPVTSGFGVWLAKRGSAPFFINVALVVLWALGTVVLPASVKAVVAFADAL
jgi:hypothetical protein